MKSHEGWCLLLMASRYSGETDLPGISEWYADRLGRVVCGRGMTAPWCVI